MVVAVDLIKDAAFEANRIQDYNLSLLLGPDRLSYLVVDPAANRLLLLGSYVFEKEHHQQSAFLINHLTQLFQEDEYLHGDYAEIDLFLHTRRVLLAHQSDLEKGREADYFHEFMPLGLEDHFRYEELQAKQQFVLYSVQLELEQWLMQQFPKATLHSASTAILQSCQRLFAQEESLVLVSIKSRSICITVQQSGQLVFHQVFGFANAEDCLYYILKTYQQLELSTEEQALHLAGELIQDSEIYKLLFRYIRHVHFVDRPDFLEYGEEIRALPAHFYFDLWATKA